MVVGMLEITVRAEMGWQRFVRPGIEELGALVSGLGERGNRFLIIQRIPDLPDHFIQTWHEDEAGGAYVVEYRDGGRDRQFESRFDGPEQVLAALIAWAGDDSEWGVAWEWRPMDLGAAEPVPALDLEEQERILLEQRVRLAIVAGYDGRGRLSELAQEYLVTQERRPVSAAQAGQLVDQLWLERVAEQSAWVGETDPERLSRAFLALEGLGVIARENFTCCRSCGRAEIGAAGPSDARGFVYFHQQCTDAAAAGHGLTLLYGGFDGAAETTVSIGREVVAALDAVGLPVCWDGDPSRGIEVKPLDWRKRLVG